MQLSNWLVAGLVLGAASVAIGEVKLVTVPPVIDGKLDDACWKAAKWEGNFKRLKKSNSQLVSAQTEFALVADARTLYVGVRGYEPRMDKLRQVGRTSMYYCDSCEIFLSPDGKPFEFYQFAVSAMHGMSEPMYHAEGGLTFPDPYAPEWRHAAALGDDHWSVEMAIPLSAFYLTRNANWRSEWLVNVVRTTIQADPFERTTWSDLEYRFPEPKRFRKVGGFPMREAADDVGMTDASVKIDGNRGGALRGAMSFRIAVAEGGRYRFRSSFCETTELDLKSGLNDVSVRCQFPKPARYDVPMELERIADGRRFRRSHSLPVTFEALMVRLAKPQYRNNFYPGQDSSVITGTCKAAIGGSVEATLEGPGIPKTSVTVGADGAFAFATPNFQIGTAELVFRSGDDERRVKVRKLAKSKHRSTWIENGHLVMDGKPLFRRNFYGWGGGCTPAFLARVARDDFRMTPEMSVVDIQFGRMVRDAEQVEGTKDQMPSAKVFAAIDKRIDDNRERDFGYYYIIDEPECRGLSPVYLAHIYDRICERDPYHVIMTCSKNVVRFENIADCFEAHPYLTPRYDDGVRCYPAPMSIMGASADRFRALGRKDKLIGVTAAAFAFKEVSPDYDYPTFDEFTANNWAMLLGGAKTVFPFVMASVAGSPQLYEGTRYLFSSCEALQNYLMLGEWRRIVKNDQVDAAVWLLNGQRMFAVLNYLNRPQKVSLKGIEGSFVEFRGDRRWTVAPGSSLDLELYPFELVIGTTEPIGTELEKRDAVKRRIATMEWARLHRDNQLVGKYVELDVSHCSSGFIPPCTEALFDGLTDNQCGTFWKRGQTDPYLEIGFKRGPLTFRQVHLWGVGVASASFEVMVNGKWLRPDATAREIGTYDLQVTFPEAVTAERLRITFADRVRLSEVEIPCRF